MSSITENLGLTLPAGSEWADVAVLNENWEKIDRQVLRAMAAAAAYDAGATYQKGAYCTQGGLLYRANRAIAQPEAWTAGHWTAISVTDVIRGLTAADVGAVPTSQKGTAGGVATLGSNGQLPYAQAPHLTANVALYVSPTGNDDNPGTQQAPFKTIQAAVDSLPRDLGNFAVTILLAEGTYDEDVTISGFVGGAPYYAFSIRTESAEHTESCQVKSIRIINCVPMVQMKWFSITGTGQQAAAIEVEGSTAWLDGMILQYQGDVGTTSGVLAGNYGQTTVRMSSSSIEGYRWGFRNGPSGKSSLNTCTIGNCTTGAYAIESIMFLVNVTYTGNQTDKQRDNYAQIYDSTNPN